MSENKTDTVLEEALVSSAHLTAAARAEIYQKHMAALPKNMQFFHIGQLPADVRAAMWDHIIAKPDAEITPEDRLFAKQAKILMWEALSELAQSGVLTDALLLAQIVVKYYHPWKFWEDVVTLRPYLHQIAAHFEHPAMAPYLAHVLKTDEPAYLGHPKASFNLPDDPKRTHLCLKMSFDPKRPSRVQLLFGAHDKHTEVATLETALLFGDIEATWYIKTRVMDSEYALQRNWDNLRQLVPRAGGSKIETNVRALLEASKPAEAHHRAIRFLAGDWTARDPTSSSSGSSEPFVSMYAAPVAYGDMCHMALRPLQALYPEIKYVPVPIMSSGNLVWPGQPDVFAQYVFTKLYAYVAPTFLDRLARRHAQERRMALAMGLHNRAGQDAALHRHFRRGGFGEVGVMGHILNFSDMYADSERQEKDAHEAVLAARRQRNDATAQRVKAQIVEEVLDPGRRSKKGKAEKRSADAIEWATETESKRPST